MPHFQEINTFQHSSNVECLPLFLRVKFKGQFGLGQAIFTANLHFFGLFFHKKGFFLLFVHLCGFGRETIISTRDNIICDPIMSTTEQIEFRFYDALSRISLF